MVQTEVCRPCGAHIFSEKVVIFGLANLKVAIKSAKKKKYDTKFKRCTPWEISPIWNMDQSLSADNFSDELKISYLGYFTYNCGFV